MTDRLSQIAARSNGPVRVTRPVRFPSDSLDIGDDEDDIVTSTARVLEKQYTHEEHRCPCGTVSYGPPDQPSRCPTCRKPHGPLDTLSKLGREVRDAIIQYDEAKLGELKADANNELSRVKIWLKALTEVVSKDRAPRRIVERQQEQISDLSQRLQQIEDDRVPATIDQCPGCGIDMGNRAHMAEACSSCENRYPPSLLKAAIDPFSYGVLLRDGTYFEFQEAQIHGDFVHLTSQTAAFAADETNARWHFPRGVDIRVSDIVLCADAPYGS